jgi:glycosyltransferase involved in cell wall biosynthesis
MRALVQIRPNHGAQVGGDTIHAVRTAEELRRLAVQVDVSGELAPDLSPYDLVHLFNTEVIEPTFRHALRARACGVPIVLSPVFWRGESIRDESFALIDRENASRREWATRAIVYGLADVLVPNSLAEADVIRARFPVVSENVVVARLGVEPVFAHGDGKGFSRRHALPYRGFVLCAARIEPRKNQHRLIAVCAELDLPLVLVGAVYEDRRAYADECRRRAELRGADVRFLPSLETAELADAFAAARVHALPSLWESVGLSSVEAALAGCNVVSTVHCGVREYLGDHAWYCDPESDDGIRDAVSAAFAAELGDELRAVAARSTWRESARATLAAYEAAMSRRRERGDWSAPLDPDAYIEHLESLIQIQLETIALRDGHYADVRKSAEALEREREQLEQYALSLEEERKRLQAALDPTGGHYAHLRENARKAIEYAQSLERERERLEQYALSLEDERKRLQATLDATR